MTVVMMERRVKAMTNTEQELKIKILQRKFVFDGKTFDDPNPNFSIERVKGYLANNFPTIINSVVKQQKTVNGFLQIELTKNGGTHG
jgi:PRTRC genetic system protein C